MNSRVPHVGTYRRELPVSLERLYENAIDWEHLPWLHRTTFAQIERTESGDWGFRARVWTHPFQEQRAFVIELRLDRECRRWITSTLEGTGTGTEIWTHAFSLAERKTLVVVDFFVPDVDDAAGARLGDYYKRLYARLYDEDVAMMSRREQELDRVRGAGRPEPKRKDLGNISTLRAKLPFDVELNGAQFRIIELDGKLVAYSTRCPHLLGPLGAGRLEGGIVECPWHGYRFDISSGKCVSGGDCQLAMAPRVSIDKAGNTIVET
ncbi:MAG TPA: Rieske (2Fe-2S) protein [Candidatus Binataceae bacterium]|nr:Rieske (2Fe-2S) protein [Candidatus Binataceae bacterium]